MKKGVGAKTGFILSGILLMSCFISVLVQGDPAGEWSGNSSYKYWQGHKVGAISLGIWWDETGTGQSMPRIEVGCSAARGEDWHNDPAPGYYYVTTQDFYLTITATDIWVDQNGNGIRDEGEPDGDTTDVSYELVKTGDCGNSDKWETLVDIVWDAACGLSGVYLPNPFNLMGEHSYSGATEKIVVHLGDPGEFGSFRTRIDYGGWEEGDHYITLKVEGKVQFIVWREPPDRRRRGITIEYTTNIKKSHYIEMVITVE